MIMDISIEKLTSGLNLKKASNGNYHCFNKSEHTNNDSNASLSLKQTNGIVGYNCFGCGISGNVYELVIAVKYCNYSEAKSWLLHNVSSYPDLNKLKKSKDKSNTKKKLQLRFIQPSNQNHRYIYKENENLNLREVNEQDFKNIYKHLFKDFNLEAFSISGAKINGFENDIFYSIVFSDISYIACKNDKSNITLLFEGQTDFLTALSVGLHYDFNIQLRKNKQEKFRLKTKINYAILDKDDNEANIQSRIDNLKGNNLQCLTLPESYKDFSDYVNGENLTKDKQEVLDYILSQVEIVVEDSIIKEISKHNLKFFPPDFDLSEVNDLIYTKDNKLIHNHVVELFKKHTELIYLKEKGKKGFFHYQEGVWQFIDERIVMNEARILISSDRVDSTVLDKIQKLLQVVLFKTIPTNLENYNLINYSNGVFDFDNLKYLSHSKDYYFFDKMDFSYDINADAPFTKKFLEEITMNDSDLLSHLLDVSCRIFIKNTDGFRIICFLGNGENGKSKFIKALTMQIPFEQTFPSFDFAKLSERFYKQNFDGKKLVVSGDANPELKNLNIVKEITGNDDLAGDVKYKDYKKFQFFGLIIIASNDMLSLTEIHSLKPLLRRLTIIPFYFKPTNIDNHIEQKLRNERSGFLNILIEQLKSLKSNNSKITYSEAVADRMKEFKKRCHLIVRFIDEQNVKLENIQDLKSLYSRFKTYLSIEHNISHSTNLKGDLSPSGFAQAIEILKDTNLLGFDDKSS